MSLFKSFNDTVDSLLDPVLSDPFASAIIKLSLVLFGGYAAPKMPTRFGPLLANSWFRMFILTMIVWINNHDPAIAILVAVVYFMTMSYITKNMLKEVARTGVVTPDVAIVISGGNGPSLKPQRVFDQEARLMQESVSSAISTGYLTAPQSVVSNSSPNTSASQVISTQPSGTAETGGMMAEKNVEVPQALVPDFISDLALAPQ